MKLDAKFKVLVELLEDVPQNIARTNPCNSDEDAIGIGRLQAPDCEIRRERERLASAPRAEHSLAAVLIIYDVVLLREQALS